LTSAPDPSTAKSSQTPVFSFQEFLNLLDAEYTKMGENFLNNRDRKFFMDKKKFPPSVAYLHRHLPRIKCYGFRGDKRDPTTLKAGEGFYPGVTRTDPGVDKYEERAKAIDEALKNAENDGGEAYRQVMKDLDILTLGVYTASADFKGYVSATTSTAIAKHFANRYAEPPNLFDPVYCYAVRCDGGFHLPTEATGAWSSQRDAQNAFTHYAEQEVAVPGGIGWGNVVGMRKIRVAKTGQFFSGPVFLNDLLRKEYQDDLPEREWIHGMLVKVHRTPEPDNGAFDELFELFSGKSQGAHPAIYWSYEVAPFDCPADLISERNTVAKIELLYISQRWL
jgi:hypothetical protein